MSLTEVDSSALILKYTKVSPDAYPPIKGVVKAMEISVKSSMDITIPAHGSALADTGLKFIMPNDCIGRIVTMNNFVGDEADVITESSREVLKIVLFNHSYKDCEVKKGDIIAQLICEKIHYPGLEKTQIYPELEEVEDLTDTVRAEGAMGVTGTK